MNQHIVTLKSFVRQIIQKSIRRVGLELHRIDDINCPSLQSLRPTMRKGLKWLADEGIQINTVLDVGASNGGWSVECMAFYPDANYVLFEPQPVHSNALNNFANGCKQNVFLVKKAVGSSDGYTLFDAADPFGGALSDKEGENTIRVDLTTIDSTLFELQTEAPYLLKLDTHGFEKSILSGSNSTLEKCEVLIIEAYNYRITEEAFLFWELCTYLAARGFRPVDLVDVLHRTYDNSLWQMDLIFIRDTWKGFDYISYK
jgi:FkbM family methyltransferase